MKINNFEITSKTYCSALNTLYNGNKTPIIQPLLKDGILEYDFKIQVKNFNKFFASQCKKAIEVISLNFKIIFHFTHSKQQQIIRIISFNPIRRLNSINFDNSVIIKIIRSLHDNKTHGQDDILVRMTKMCDEALINPLSVIFMDFIDAGVYPDISKKSNIMH